MAVSGGLLRAGVVYRVDRTGPGPGADHRPVAHPIGAAVGDAARAVAEVAAAHGVSWPTAHRAFVAHADAELAEPQPTPVLGIDETRRGKPRWDAARRPGGGCASTRGTPGSSTWPAPRACSGSVEGRTGEAVVSWLRERTHEFRDGDSSSWRSTRPRSMPWRSARPGCCPTRRWSSITSTW